MIRVRACGLSDVGKARSHNEDCFGIDPEHQMFVVADGMGGHKHGEVASRIAVKAIQEFIELSADHDSTWPHQYDSSLLRHTNRLKTSIHLAHDKVLRAIRVDESLMGMGTTIVCLLLQGSVASVAHVGDSRAYRVRNGSLELLTQDHTWVNEQVMAGYLSLEQARVHPLKNVVTRALGGENEVMVDVQEIEAEPGDCFILCSDGLTTMLSDDEICERVAVDKPLEDTCRTLVRDANAKGGLDNITVLLLAVDEVSVEED